MVNGFVEETKTLDFEEIKAAKIMSEILENRIGDTMAVNNHQLIQALKLRNYKVSSARIRAIIHHIRVNRLVTNLVASSKGYYREFDQERLNKYIQSLQQRINSIYEIKKSFL